MSSLYRQEALDYQAHAFAGDLFLILQLALSILVGLACVLFCAFVLLFAFLQIPETLPAQGEIEPQAGVITLAANQRGLVKLVEKNQGAHVKAGERIALISDVRKNANGQDVQDAVSNEIRSRLLSTNEEKAKKLRQLAENEKLFANKLQLFNAKLHSTMEEITIQQSKLQVAKLDLQTFQEYSRKGYLSQAGLQSRQSAVFDIEAHIKALERNKISSQQEIADLSEQREKNRAATDSELNVLNRASASHQQELLESESQNIQHVAAPQNGIISSLMIRPGQFLTDGQAMLSIIPDNSPLQARLYVPESAISFLKIGNKVALRYRAFPFQLYGKQWATIRSIADSPLNMNGNRNEQPVYLVTAELNSEKIGQNKYIGNIRAGMQVAAEIIIDSQTIPQLILGMR